MLLHLRQRNFRIGAELEVLYILPRAPYHPATNGAAERLVQTFKKALKKSSLPPRAALQEFLMQYRRTPLESGYSPSELLNGRKIRTLIDVLVPVPAQQLQKQTEKSKALTLKQFQVGSPCYALYFGPRRDKEGRWVPAIIRKKLGSRSVNVQVYPRGPVWRRHLDQLRPRYASIEDAEPGDDFVSPDSSISTSTSISATHASGALQSDDHSAPKLRRSTRNRNRPQRYGTNIYDLQS